MHCYYSASQLGLEAGSVTWHTGEGGDAGAGGGVVPCLRHSLSESCHDMYCLGSVTTACCWSRNWPRCTLHYSSQLHCTVCTAPVHSVRGDTGTRQCTPTFYSKEQGVVRTNTRHPPPPPHDVIIHHAHHQPAAEEETHDNLGLQSRHDTL